MHPAGPCVPVSGSASAGGTAYDAGVPMHATDDGRGRDPTAFARWAVLAVLTAINLVNYIDRYVVSAVAAGIAEEFRIGDDITGMLGTAFMLPYAVVAPLSGWLGDRIDRRYVVAGAVAVWSVATLGSAWAPDIDTLLVMRVIVGVGEAGYATVAPSMIADLYPLSERGRKLAWFYVAIPVGSALGFLIGGWTAQQWGWRAAFVVASGPGLLLALVALRVPEPLRGRYDGGELKAAVSAWVALRTALANPHWRAITIGMTLMTFSMGGLGFWMPTLLQRSFELDEGPASTLFGVTTVVAGLLGTMIGGVLGDRWLRRDRGAYLMISGWGLLIGAPFVLAMPLVDSLPLAIACTFVAEMLLFLNTGPLNAALVDAISANMRASAIAINVFCIHAFGDAGSPYLIGLISSRSALAFAVALCAVPVAIGGVVLLRGAMRLRREAVAGV